MSTSLIESFSCDVQETLINLDLRIRPATSAYRMWRRHLQPPDQQRLGGNFEEAFRRRGTIGMWMDVFGVSPVRALLDVACAINFLDPQNYRWLLKETGEADESALLNRAIESGALVLSEEREAYFDTSLIELDWYDHDTKWSFFWKLARISKRGGRLDYFALGENAEPRDVSDNKNRLKKIIPADLFNLITTARKAGCRIELPPNMIRLFIYDQTEMLVEWTGWEPALGL